MDIHSRLKHLEDIVFGNPAGDDLSGQWATLQREFEGADSVHANVIGTLGKATGTRSLARLVKGSSRDPETSRLLVHLRKALATFCRERRYLVPGAKLVRVRSGNNVIVPGDEAGGRAFLQVMADFPIRTGGAA